LEVTMENIEVTPDSKASPGPAKPAPRRKAAPRKKSSAATARPAARKKAPKARPASAKRGRDVWTDLVAGRASAAGARIARFSKDSAGAARRALENVRGLSKKTAKRLFRDWQEMDARRRAQLVATLIAALGVAAAPLVRSRMKKK
jgi:hypothetical protein